MIKRITSLLVFFLIPSIVFAGYTSCGSNCYLADTASDSDVQTAIDAADAADGGEVRIPTDTKTWTSRVSKTLTHDLVINGAGIANTIINTGVDYPLQITANGNISIIIKNIRMNATADLTNGLINIRGTSLYKAVLNMYFDFYGRGIIFGNPNDATQGAGVIANCTFYNSHATGQAISLEGNTAGSNFYWDGLPQFGTVNELYIEDNSFIFPNGEADGAFDAYSGAKIVFRHNTVNGTSIGWHGNDSSSSLHSAEIYSNTFTSSIKLNFAINIRGGTALIWGNTFDSNYPQVFLLSLYRSCQATGRDSHLCDGSGTFDSNTEASGYRCYQQPGSTGTNGITQWPIIEWDNNYNGGTNNMGFDLNANFLKPLCMQAYDSSDHIKEGRDYINHDTCVGVSSAFCATWWDDVNKKAKNYTPYTCPHPLAGTGSCDPNVAGRGGYGISLGGGGASGGMNIR